MSSGYYPSHADLLQRRRMDVLAENPGGNRSRGETFLSSSDLTQRRSAAAASGGCCCERGPTGPTGPMGPTGPSGPQGETGPAGTLSLSYGNVFSSTQQLLNSSEVLTPPNTAFIFDGVSFISGISVLGSQLSVDYSGTYLVNYRAQVFGGVGGNVRIIILVNGVALPDSGTTITMAPEQFTLINSNIILNLSAGNYIEFFGIGPIGSSIMPTNYPSSPVNTGSPSLFVTIHQIL